MENGDILVAQLKGCQFSRLAQSDNNSHMRELILQRKPYECEIKAVVIHTIVSWYSGDCKTNDFEFNPWCGDDSGRALYSCMYFS